MSTHLAKQLAARIKAKNLSVAALEKEAGLKTHSVRNIVRGKSKKPSAETLQAISEVLGCTVKDLLTDQVVFRWEGEDSDELKEALLDQKFEHSELLLKTVHFILERLETGEQTLSIQQVLNCVEEIYLHSLQKKLTEVDLSFGDWFIDLANN